MVDPAMTLSITTTSHSDDSAMRGIVNPCCGSVGNMIAELYVRPMSEVVNRSGEGHWKIAERELQRKRLWENMRRLG